jgi:hypothetical protein
MPLQMPPRQHWHLNAIVMLRVLRRQCARGTCSQLRAKDSTLARKAINCMVAAATLTERGLARKRRSSSPAPAAATVCGMTGHRLANALCWAGQHTSTPTQKPVALHHPPLLAGLNDGITHFGYVRVSIAAGIGEIVRSSLGVGEFPLSSRDVLQGMPINSWYLLTPRCRQPSMLCLMAV